MTTPCFIQETKKKETSGDRTENHPHYYLYNSAKSEGAGKDMSDSKPRGVKEIRWQEKLWAQSNPFLLAWLCHYVVSRYWCSRFRRLFCCQAVHSLLGVVQVLAQPEVLPVVSREGVLELERSLLPSNKVVVKATGARQRKRVRVGCGVWCWCW